MNGQDATAGSIFKEFMINGIKAPSDVDTVKAMKMEVDVTAA